MTCEPDELAELAACWCFDERTDRAVVVYLLCAWLLAVE
jgi:hypothetical protein